jgi:hypothetical protein
MVLEIHEFGWNPGVEVVADFHHPRGEDENRLMGCENLMDRSMVVWIVYLHKEKPPGVCPEGLSLVCILVQGDDKETDGEKKWNYPQGTICRNGMDEGYEDTTETEYCVHGCDDAIVSFVFHM